MHACTTYFIHSQFLLSVCLLKMRRGEAEIDRRHTGHRHKLIEHMHLSLARARSLTAGLRAARALLYSLFSAICLTMHVASVEQIFCRGQPHRQGQSPCLERRPAKCGSGHRKPE
jgi:hypothetical protein